MIGFTALAYAPSEAKTLLDKAREVFAKLPDVDEYADYLSCHIVARVIASTDPEEFLVVDGLCGIVNHSWLVLQKHPGWVIDALPVGQVGGPVLLDVRHPSPWQKLYQRKVINIPEFRIYRTVSHMLRTCDL